MNWDWSQLVDVQIADGQVVASLGPVVWILGANRPGYMADLASTLAIPLPQVARLRDPADLPRHHLEN